MATVNLSLCPWKFQRNKALPLKALQNCVMPCPWRFQGQKPKPIMEIPHDFILITPGNSTSFLIGPWNFHMLILEYLWKFHILSPPVWIFVFDMISLTFNSSGRTEERNTFLGDFKITSSIFPTLTRNSPMLPLYTPWKHQKTFRFLMFSGGIEKQHQAVMG